MEMRALPAWVSPTAVVFVVLAVMAALAVAYDIYGRGHRQGTRLMEPVWVLSALWLGPFVLPLYLAAGRRHGPGTAGRPPADRRVGLPLAAAMGGLAGGAASLVGHVIGVPLVLATGWTLFGVDMFAMIAVVAVLAVALLFAFEYAVSRRGATMATGGTGLALLVAVLTVVAFDLGMGGWMLLLHFNGLMPPVSSVSFLFLMQVGIVLGFLTGFPAVAYLVRQGAKHAV